MIVSSIQSENDVTHVVRIVDEQLPRKQEHCDDTVETFSGIALVQGRFSKSVHLPPFSSSVT